MVEAAAARQNQRQLRLVGVLCRGGRGRRALLIRVYCVEADVGPYQACTWLLYELEEATRRATRQTGSTKAAQDFVGERRGSSVAVAGGNWAPGQTREKWRID